MTSSSGVGGAPVTGQEADKKPTLEQRIASLERRMACAGIAVMALLGLVIVLLVNPPR